MVTRPGAILARMNTQFDSLPFAHAFGPFFLSILAVLIVWTLCIKGLALWRAARNGHTAWFVVLLIVNTLGILELIYLLSYSKRTVAHVVTTASTPVVSQASDV